MRHAGFVALVLLVGCSTTSQKDVQTPDLFETSPPFDTQFDFGADTTVNPDTAPPADAVEVVEPECQLDADCATKLGAAPICRKRICKEEKCQLAMEPNGTACDDSTVCTSQSTCQGGTCQGSGLVSCDDENVCTQDACDPVDGCVHWAKSGACDDGNKCTLNDTCQDKVCQGQQAACLDDNPCTDDVCDVLTGYCEHPDNTMACDDSDACTQGDVCSEGVCKSGAWICPPPCGDGFCSPDQNCVTCPEDCGECTAVCEDGTCEFPEDCATCPADCGVCPECGDGACESGETCQNCPTDCGACPSVCGNGQCEAGETCLDCQPDCGECPLICGNALCEPPETCGTCSQDCGVCPPKCGDLQCNGTETCTSCPGDCGQCPGSCCIAGPGRGCLDDAVEACVCQMRPECCSQSWDSVCAAMADSCGSCSGSACLPHLNPGADSEFIEDCVCSAYPECCLVTWDANCVMYVKESGCGSCDICGDNKCAWVAGENCGTCPSDCGTCPAHSCCYQNEVAQCSDGAVVGCVCAKEPGCCTGSWTAACALMADACGGCNGPTCVAHTTPGADDNAAEQCLCATMPACCTSAWDIFCAKAVTTTNCATYCQGVPGDGICDPAHGENCATRPEDCGACPTNSCCAPSLTPSCNQPTVVDCVCNNHPECCHVAWSQQCTEFAKSCGACNGSCCTAHAGPGCAIAAVEDAVCAIEPNCCINSWHAGCVALVSASGQYCGGTCCTTHSTVGCSVAAVETCVCNKNFNCCYNDPEYGGTWSTVCVNHAKNDCGAICN